MAADAQVRLDSLVLAAAALEGEELRSFLGQLENGGDRALAREVRRRLRAAQHIGESFLKSPATTLLEAACNTVEPEAPALLENPGPTETEAATPVGNQRYEILELLGQGGAARVYRALDHRLGRTVALKLIHQRDHQGPLPEARSQARVQHDHVLEVYDTGELDGQPYVAMRHVEGGRTLSDLERSLGLEPRVRLLIQAAEGLHAAHREGLLHRDVKPSNVLVESSPDGEMKALVADFGIATELSEDTASLAGTPDYMAPELLGVSGSQVDRRSDVYSLGVTAAQVLGAELPKRNRADSEPLWSAPLPADLRAVLRRCLAERPEARYPSARAVAADLRRFLDGEVVEAYADRLAYRLTRFALRHRSLLTTIAISSLLLVLALAIAAAMGFSALRANERAQDRQVQAEDLIGFMLLDLRDKLEPAGRLELLDAVGERAMRYFAAVPETELSDEELARRSVALYQIGDLHIRRGDLQAAEQPLAESLALARRLAARDPHNAERRFGLGQSEFWAGYALWERGELAAARQHMEAYLAISQELAQREPQRQDWQRELAYAHSNMGSVHEEAGELPAALRRFLAALVIDRNLVLHAKPGEALDEARFELAATHNTIGAVLEQLGRLAEAQQHFEADLELRQQLLQEQPRHQRWREFLGTSHQYLGTLHLAQGELAESRLHLEQAGEIFEQLAQGDTTNTGWRYKLAWNLLRLGQLARAEGLPDTAGQAWQRARANATELQAAQPEPVDFRQLSGVAWLHLAGPWGDASLATRRSALESALSILQPLAQQRPTDGRAQRWWAQGLLAEGDRLAAAGRRDAAEEVWKRALAALQPFVATSTQDDDYLLPWAATLQRLQRDSEAGAVLETLAQSGYEPCVYPFWPRGREPFCKAFAREGLAAGGIARPESESDRGRGP